MEITKHSDFTKLVTESFKIGKKISITSKGDLVKRSNYVVIPDIPQRKAILAYLYLTGATDYYLTDNDDANKQIIIKFFDQLVVKNKFFPLNMKITYVLDKFTDAVVQGDVELKGLNLRSQVKAFKEWILVNLHIIAQEYYLYYGEKEPNKLPKYAKSGISPEKISESLQMIYGDNVPDIFTKYLKITDK